MPPMSVTSAWSAMRSMTGCGVSESNSVEFAPLQAGQVPGDVDHHHLQAEAEPEAGDVVLAGVAGGGDHPLDRRARRSRRG